MIMPNQQTGSLFFYETVVFYQKAPDEWINQFESLLDEDRVEEAHNLVQKFFDEEFSKQSIVGKKRSEYTQEPPEPGDMVIYVPTRRHVRLLSISDDKQLCLVKEMLGAYVVPFDKVVRVR
jgi:hypothetical protein